MGTTFVWIVFLIGIISLVYYQCTVKIWLPVSAILLLLLSFFLSPLFIILFWLIWFLAAVFLLASGWRIKKVTKPILKWFSSLLPPLSLDEKEALEAGGIWWEGQLFTGRPCWDKLFAYPKPQLTDEEQSFLDNEATHLCEMLDDWQIVHVDENLPEVVWDYIKKNGFWGLIIDKAHGGKAFSATAHLYVIAKVASRSLAAAVAIMVPNSLGPAEFIMHYGTDEQKDYYLPRLAIGEDIACFGLTETGAGSDATSIQASGVVCKGEFAGKMVVGIKLNFAKRYITLAPIATVAGIAFNLFDPDHLLGENENVGITFALIRTNLPGVESGKRHRPVNNGFLNGPIRGKDVFIPVDWIIGGVEQRGRGWHMMVQCLAVGRCISLPGLQIGGTSLGVRMTSAYAQLRWQFRMPIGEFEGVGLLLGETGALNYLIKAASLFTVKAVDEGARPAVASAIVKYHLTEFGRRCILHSLDIHAGRAIQTGPRNYSMTPFISMPIGIAVEGANILTRNLIIFGQGVFKCHPYLTQELVAAKEPNNADKVKQFDNLLFKHINFVVSNFVRTFLYGLTGGFLIYSNHRSPLKKYIKQLTRMSCAFALIIDIALLTYGGKLKLKESMSARLGDILSYLYMASAVMKFYVDSGEIKSDWPLVEWCLDYCLYKVQESFDSFLDNFPSYWAGRFLMRLVFPWRRAYFMPKDSVSFAISKAMQTDLAFRDRLTKVCFISDNPNDATGRIEHVFAEWHRLSPLFKKIKSEAKKNPKFTKKLRLKQQIEEAYRLAVITEAEKADLQKFLLLQMDAMEVDEFSFNVNNGEV